MAAFLIAYIIIIGIIHAPYISLVYFISFFYFLSSFVCVVRAGSAGASPRNLWKWKLCVYVTKQTSERTYEQMNEIKKEITKRSIYIEYERKRT